MSTINEESSQCIDMGRGHEMGEIMRRLGIIILGVGERIVMYRTIDLN